MSAERDSRPDRPPPESGAAACTPPLAREAAGLVTVALTPSEPLADYREAMRLAEAEARAHFGSGDPMLLSWYDRDRDFEAPQHVSECHEASAVPGYVDYALSRGARLKVDVENGRFVFFFRSGEE
jgi:hypothetical protein